ncbi:MAG: hypothetical protein JSS09_07110 [Verrucomicrobia bacterium]|nr:hypothetical protein [Verrucomicrobiota bacterium]
MKEGIKQGLSENCIVAIRFLAVFDPNQINSFFQNMNISLKSGDIFVFNYSLSGDEARTIGAKTSSGYELKENTGVQMLFHKGDHIQTFLTKNFIEQLLAKTGFEIVLERAEQILDTRGTDLVRGQNDPYPRITVFVVKK